MSQQNWIAVDWGTTHLRASLIGDDGTVCDTADSPDGMAAVRAADGEFESTLVRLIEPWLNQTSTTTVIACGMVGARQGWHEVPYDTVPCSPTATLHEIPTTDARLRAGVVSGVKQLAPPDVMRGEETQISGLLTSDPEFDGLVCLPGTHSKWVRVSAGKIQEFQTFMTGEMFELAAEQSILKHTVSKRGTDERAFLSGVRESFATPSSFLTQLFSIRAEDLLQDLEPEVARSRLSGLFIGLELAGAITKWNSPNVAIIGSENLGQLYESAQTSLGISCECFDAASLTIQGLLSHVQSIQT